MCDRLKGWVHQVCCAGVINHFQLKQVCYFPFVPAKTEYQRLLFFLTVKKKTGKLLSILSLHFNCRLRGQSFFFGMVVDIKCTT